MLLLLLLLLLFLFLFFCLLFWFLPAAVTYFRSGIDLLPCSPPVRWNCALRASILAFSAASSIPVRADLVAPPVGPAAAAAVVAAVRSRFRLLSVCAAAAAAAEPPPAEEEAAAAAAVAVAMAAAFCWRFLVHGVGVMDCVILSVSVNVSTVSRVRAMLALSASDRFALKPHFRVWV